MAVIITFVMTLAAFAVTALSCRSDFRSLRIPNGHSLAVLGCFVPAWLAMPEAFAPLWQHLAAMGIIFGVTYIMFCLNMIGGGDSKLGAAAGLWVGLKGLAAFLLYMSIMGGVLGIAAIVMRKIKFFKNPLPESWIGRVQKGESALPYGIAISVGMWGALIYSGFVYKLLNEVFKIIH